MASKQATQLMHAIQRLHAQGKGQKAIAKLLGCGQNTVRRALASDPKFGARIAPRLLIVARKHLPAPQRQRRALPPQLKQLDPQEHARLKHYHRLYGSIICSVWWPSTPDEFERYIFGRSKKDATEFLALVKRLGFPESPALDEAYVRSLFHCGAKR